MRNWSIERKVLLALACAALVPLSAYVLLREFAIGTARGQIWTNSLFATAVLTAVAATLALLRHVYLDVKRHHDVEQRLQSANRFLESLLDNIPTMIFAKDAKDLRFLHFNRAGETLLGYQRGELIGKSDRDFFSAEQVEFFMEKDREVLAQGDVVDIPEEQIDTREGRKILHTRKVPVRDAQGKPLLLLGISMDVTEQKANERRILALMEDLKQHASMLESSNQELESFCYSVSHDLRAPLRAINGYAQLLQQQYASQWDEAGSRYLQRICSASVRMADLIDDLLEYSRLGRQRLTLTKLDMHALVTRAIEDVAGDREHTGSLFTIESLQPGNGDHPMMERVWLNLLDNAVKYSSGVERANITVGSMCREDEIVYYVKDNGVGFDMRYSDKLFGVFQRLHGAEEFDGTGVGLAIAQRILVRHGGRIWAEGEPGKGASFYFSLPVAAEILV